MLADDFPLNVSRETPQSTKFLKQLKGILIKWHIQLPQRILDDDPEKFNEMSRSTTTLPSLALSRPRTSQRKRKLPLSFVSTRISVNVLAWAHTANSGRARTRSSFLANVGQTIENLKKSVFIEKLTARARVVVERRNVRGFICGWRSFADPGGEQGRFVTTVRVWKNLSFQDAAKKGYGDEDPEADKKQMEEYTERYRPLLDFFTKKTNNLVEEVISNRLVTSPCAIVVDAYGYFTNMEKLLGEHKCPSR